MGYTSPGKSSTTPLMMGAWQLPAGGLAAERWKDQMARWKPAATQTGGRVGITPQALTDAQKAAEMIGMGGYTPGEQRAKGAMMPYATGMKSFYNIPELGEKATAYGTGISQKMRGDLQEAIDKLGTKYAARGKHGSGGHLAAIQDLITRRAEGETDVTTQLAATTLGKQREMGMQEAGGRQQLLATLSNMFGAQPTMQRMGGLQNIATLPRQYALSDIDRQNQIWQRNMADLLGTLGEGVGLSTGGMGGVSGSGMSGKDPGMQAASWIQAIAKQALGGWLSGSMMGSSGYGSNPAMQSFREGMYGTGMQGAGGK